MEFDKKRLILIYNNPPNARMGAILKSLGLERGPSDQLFFSPIGKMVWLEYKIDNRKQEPEQETFEKMVRSFGCEYEIIRDEDQFNQIIKKYSNGIQTSGVY